MQLQGTVQNLNSQDGSQPNISLGRQSEIIESNLHGRFYTQAYRGNLFSWGKTVTALSANSITLTASTTPIIGVWNPATSTVNLSILQASVQVIQQASSTATGAFVWATSTGNGAISTGNAPLNRKTLANSGSQAKGFDLATALTGLTNNLVIQEAADFAGLAVTTASVTAATVINVEQSTQMFDGSIIIPPGGVLALLNTTSTTNVSVSSRILWEEVVL